jgi:hypothetical protein
MNHLTNEYVIKGIINFKFFTSMYYQQLKDGIFQEMLRNRGIIIREEIANISEDANYRAYRYTIIKGKSCNACYLK